MCRYYKIGFLIALSHTSALMSPVSEVSHHSHIPLSKKRGRNTKKKKAFSASGTPIFQLLLQFTEKCFSLGKSGTFCCLGEKRRPFSSEDVGDKLTLVFILVVHGCSGKDLKKSKYKNSVGSGWNILFSIQQSNTLKYSSSDIWGFHGIKIPLKCRFGQCLSWTWLPVLLLSFQGRFCCESFS